MLLHSIRNLISGLLGRVDCEFGKARLRDGSDQYSGIVEVCQGDSYTSICDTDATFQDAIVVCREVFGDEKSKLEQFF